jgi:hypothetical protein
MNEDIGRKKRPNYFLLLPIPPNVNSLEHGEKGLQLICVEILDNGTFTLRSREGRKPCTVTREISSRLSRKVGEKPMRSYVREDSVGHWSKSFLYGCLKISCLGPQACWSYAWLRLGDLASHLRLA